MKFAEDFEYIEYIQYELDALEKEKADMEQEIDIYQKKINRIQVLLDSYSKGILTAPVALAEIEKELA